MKQDEAKRRFVELCKEFITRSNKIDKFVPSDVSMPEWWFTMMDMQEKASSVMKEKPAEKQA